MAIMTTLTLDDERWQAVLDRLDTDDFVVAVKTTGVYCRPSCGSRTPLRRNVVFFDSPEDARTAGFRACLRCRPDGPNLTRAVEHACRLLEEEGERIPTIDELASATGVAPDTLRRAFRKTLGVTPHQYADAHRVERLRTELRDGPDVTRAVYAAGYGSASRVYEHSDAKLGMTPGAYRDGGAGMHVRYAFAPSSLGWLMVAETDRGVCRVVLGDDPGRMEGALVDELHRATVQRDPDDELSGVMHEMLRRIEGKEPARDLPLDVRGTAFQRRVWEELQRIPRGATRTYGEIAEAIGHPRAARAVGTACAGNHAAIVIPCHRVVPAGGGVGNYAYGPERKRALLDREQSAG